MATLAAAGSAEAQEIGARRPPPAGPCAITIFGITGDLSRRLLFPALYNLARQQALSSNFAVVGFATTEASELELRDSIAADLKKAIGPGADAATITWLVSRVRYISAHFADEA